MSAVKIGSIRSANDCRQAAEMLRAGRPIGVLGRSVASIWVDPAHDEAVAEIYRIKGARRTGMPLGITLDPDELPALIDPDLIAPELHSLFLNGRDLAARLSTLVWIRFPLRPSVAATLPTCLISTTADPVMHDAATSGTVAWGQAWIRDEGDAHGVLLARLAENGLRRLAPTSMNSSGDPEIVDVEAAVEFCAGHGLSLFMRDPDDARAVRGSYPIIEVSRHGLRLVREGHFPAYLLPRLLGGLPMTLDGYRPAKYPLLQTHSLEQAQALDPYRLHDEIQAALNLGRWSAVPASANLGAHRSTQL